VDLEYRYSLWR
jgi:hypothetical protein